MRMVFLILLLLLELVPSEAAAQRKVRPIEFSDVQPSFTGRGSAMEGAADIFQASVQNWHTSTVQNQIAKWTNRETAAAKQLLGKSGQRGVLYLVRIASMPDRHNPDLTYYSFIGGNGELIGAGATPSDVYLAHFMSNRPALRAAPPEGMTFDEEASVFLWVTIDRGQVVTNGIKYSDLTYAIARKVADATIVKQAADDARNRATEAAINHLSGTVINKIKKAELDGYIKRRAEIKKQLTELSAKINREIERAEKAQSALGVLNALSTIASFGNQLQAVIGMLGADSTPQLAQARTENELRNQLQTMVLEAAQRGETARMSFAENYSADGRLQSGLYGFISGENYPVLQIPNLNYPPRLVLP